MKIVILDRKTVTIGDVDLSPLETLGEVTAFEATENADIAAHIGDAEVVLCNKSLITADVLAQCPNVKYIGLFATGYNNIDLAATKKRGIFVCNAPQYSTNAVAQHVFALVLHLLSHVSEYDSSVQNGDWIASPTFSYFNLPLREMASLTLGIIGFGSIGSTVAAIGAAFGMRVIVSTKKHKDAPYEFLTREEVFEQSDILTLHCPLTDETERLVNSENLARMKSTAILINTSRGGVVDETALAAALKGGRLYGAGLDVLTSEPMSAECPLLNVKNCIITPHIAWAPQQTRARLIGIVAANIKAYQDGKPINVVGG